MAETSLLILAREFKKLRDDTRQILAMPIGPQGDKGDTGPSGVNGIDGMDGRPGADGRNGMDGRDGVNGKDGKDGKTGPDGVDGADGVSVVDVEIDFDKHLRVKLSNGRVIDAGEIDFDAAASSVFVSGASGSGSTVGSSTIDFGSRSSDTLSNVSIPTITSSNRVQVWVDPIATVSNTVDNHWLEDLTVNAVVNNAVGFTIFAKCRTGMAHGVYTVSYAIS